MIEIGDLVRWKKHISSNRRPMVVFWVENKKGINGRHKDKKLQTVKCWDTHYGDTGFVAGETLVVISKNRKDDGE